MNEFCHKILLAFQIGFLLISGTLRSQELELIDYPFVKGSYHTGLMDSSKLYCLTDYGIFIWNLLNLSNPQHISSIPLTGVYYDGKINKIGNNLIVLRNYKLYNCDVSNDSAPKISAINLEIQKIYDFSIIDSFLIVSSFNINGFNVYNINNPENPVLVSSYSLYAAGNGFKQYNQTLFVSSGSEIFILDFSSGYLSMRDTLHFQHDIDSYISNNNILCICFAEIPDDFTPEHAYIYDLRSSGYPIIDSTTLPVNSRYDLITDSFLVASLENSRIVFDISTSGISQGSNEFNFCHSNSLSLYSDTLIINFNYSLGYNIYSYSDSKGLSFITNNNCGSWITNVSYDNNNRVIIADEDSLYLISKVTNQRLADFQNNSDLFKLKDSLLFEYKTNPYRIDYSILTKENTKLSVYEFPADKCDLYYFRLFNNYIFHTFNGIYDISDRYSPQLVSASLNNVFYTVFDNIYLEYKNYDYSFQEVNLFKLVNNKPSLIKQNYIDAPYTPYGFSTNWPANERRAYCFDYSTVFQLDYSDTSNIHYTHSQSIGIGAGAELQQAVIKDSIVFIPTPFGNALQVVDMCDENHYRLITTLNPGKFIQSMSFVDSLLYITFGGYVGRFRLKNISPCQVQTKLIDYKQEDLKTVTIFPNPSTGKISVSISEPEYKSLIIIDRLGRNIISYEIGNYSIREPICLNINLPPGIYFMIVKKQDKIVSEKLTII